jgi:hypothetical protein
LIRYKIEANRTPAWNEENFAGGDEKNASGGKNDGANVKLN